MRPFRDATPLHDIDPKPWDADKKLDGVRQKYGMVNTEFDQELSADPVLAELDR
nr:hypothetical protein [Polymorphobacter sp. PAMC 29334]